MVSAVWEIPKIFVPLVWRFSLEMPIHPRKKAGPEMAYLSPSAGLPGFRWWCMNTAPGLVSVHAPDFYKLRKRSLTSIAHSQPAILTAPATKIS